MRLDEAPEPKDFLSEELEAALVIAEERRFVGSALPLMMQGWVSRRILSGMDQRDIGD